MVIKFALPEINYPSRMYGGPKGETFRWQLLEAPELETLANRSKTL